MTTSPFAATRPSRRSHPSRRSLPRASLSLLGLLSMLALGGFFQPALAAGIPNLSSFTLPSATTAYTAGQLMANSATAGSVVVPSFTLQNVSDTTTFITRGQLQISDSTSTAWGGQTITIDLWSAAPTFTNGDRGAYLPATNTDFHLATFTCTMSAEYGDGVYGECSVAVGNTITITAVSPTKICWTTTATTGSGVTGASKTVSFTPEIAN